MLTRQSLQRFRGKRLCRVRRMHFVVDDVVDRSEGEVQFEFDDNSVLLCEGDTDGETIRLGDSPWPDPFSEPLSPDSEAFVRDHGKWVLIDVSAEAPWNRLIGSPVRGTSTIRTSDGHDRGVLIDIGGVLVCIAVSGDETHVAVL
jgi:hypothetical protein